MTSEVDGLATVGHAAGAADGAGSRPALAGDVRVLVLVAVLVGVTLALGLRRRGLAFGL
jgi:hypothetical protein